MPVPSIKYLITAYGQQPHLRRLCTTVLRLDPSCSVSVQYDQSKDPLDRSMLPSPAAVIDTPRPVTWGDSSYLDALLESMRRCMDDEWRWFVLISGQDYPLRPTQDLLAHLDRTGSAGFLGSHVVEPPGARDTWTEEQRRYWFEHRWIPDTAWKIGGGARGVGRVCRAIVRLPAVRERAYYRPRPRGDSGGIGVLARRPPFGPGRSCRKGMDYFVLSRELVNELLASAREERSLLDHFRRSAIPSESWFHTVLGDRHEGELLAEPLTFSRFRGDANPRLLQTEDLRDAIAANRFFARKFDSRSTALLDRIDHELLGLEPLHT